MKNSIEKKSLFSFLRCVGRDAFLQIEVEKFHAENDRLI